MDFRQLLSEPALKNEFFDRLDEIAAYPRIGGAGLEGLEGGIDAAQIRDAAEHMQEGRWDSGDPGLEAIIRRFTRPVYLVQNGTFAPPADDFPDSHEAATLVEEARSMLERTIASTGRIDLRNHRLDWVGTGWMAAPRIVVTNRHVAEEFSRASGSGFAFKRNSEGRSVAAYLDWCHEFDRPHESRFRVEKIQWVEPEMSADVALLLISAFGEDGEPPPQPVELMAQEDITQTSIGAWITVIGYPAYDSRNNAADQQRIFDGIYNVKRLAPGQITAFVANRWLYHDATTLGGNSGSAIVDLASGKAIALHFGGEEGEKNAAVLAPQVTQIVRRHAKVPH